MKTATDLQVNLWSFPFNFRTDLIFLTWEFYNFFGKPGLRRKTVLFFGLIVSINEVVEFEPVADAQFLVDIKHIFFYG